MSAGETCYVFKNVGGKLVHVYFGKRVEPEDDLSALGGDNARDEFVCPVLGNGKTSNFVFVGSEVLPEKPRGALTLGGGKTLKITLRDEANKLGVELYYTPYPRGGYSRRTVVRNDGNTAVTVGTVVQSVVIDGCKAETSDGTYGFVSAVSEGCNARYGEAYGFLCPFPGGETEARTHEGVTTVESRARVGKLEAGEEYVSPELLSVYADCGRDGMSRVFHDILRESPAVKYNAKRSRTTVFLPSMPSKAVRAAAERAYELGFDTLAVEFGEYSETEIEEISAACKEVGIAPGLRIESAGIKKFSAACVPQCKPLGTGYYIDKSDAEASSALIGAAERIIRANNISYVLAEMSGAPNALAFATAVFGMSTALARDMPDTTVEFCNFANDSHMPYECYPPCVLRNIVKLDPPQNLKQRFDRATFGRLAYEFDPNTADGNVKLAVRAQILSYQDDASTVVDGDLYGIGDAERCLISVSKDKSRAYAVCDTTERAVVKLCGLDEHNLYHVRELDKTFSGAALMYYGVTLPESQSVTLHLRQVADYE